MEPTDGPHPEPGEHDDSLDDRDIGLRDRLIHEAGRVEVGSAATARPAVGKLARRRTVRTRVAAGVAAVAVLGLGGIVLANVTDDDDARPTRIAEEPITETTVEEPPSTENNDATAAAGDVPGTDAEVTVPTDVPTTDTGVAVATDVPTTDGAGGSSSGAVGGGVVAGELYAGEPVVQNAAAVAQTGAVEWVLPWHDGFLAGVQPPQRLPESLPPEINEMFSQDVRDFFGGVLPPTIAEATEMLQEAGLYDEVAQVVMDNPQVYDAIFGAPLPAAEIHASTDGADWQPVEVALPDGFATRGAFVPQAASSGDRLALLGTTASAGATDPQPVRLATTTDLVGWDIIEIDPAVPPVEIPDTFGYYVQVSSLAMSGDRWIVTTDAYLEPRFEAFVDEAEEMSEAGATPTGLFIGLADGTRVDVAWEETGAAPELVALMEDSGGFYAEGRVYTGTWDGGPITSTPTEGGWGGNAVVADDGFYRMTGPGVDHSSDGVTWSPVPIAWAGHAQQLMTVDGNVATLTSDAVDAGESETALYLLDAEDRSWSRVELDLPPQLSIGGGSRSQPDGATILQQWSEPDWTDADAPEVDPDAPVNFVLASADGRRWLLDDVPTSGADGWYEHFVARNGPTVVIHNGVEWITYRLS